MSLFSSCYGDTSGPPTPDVIRLTLLGDVEGLERCLNDPGYSPDTIDADRRRTGLHHAAARGFDAAMAALLSAGADVNFKDIHGNTPLHLCGHGMTLDLLISYGADPLIENATGVTAREMMRRRGVANEIFAKLAQYEKLFDQYRAYGVEGGVGNDHMELLTLNTQHDVVALRRRANPVPPFLIVDSQTAGHEEFDLETIDHSLSERLLTPADSDATASSSSSNNNRSSNNNNRSGSVFTIMAGGCRRGRGFRPSAFESRPVSVFHEFFLSMDSKTMLIFVFSIFCLALFAAFYVTGVHMNYFGGTEEEAEDFVGSQSTVDQNLVKIVPIIKGP